MRKGALVCGIWVCSAFGCATAVPLPPVQEPLDSPAWRRCAGEEAPRRDPGSPKMAEELAGDPRGPAICRGVVLASSGKVKEGLARMADAEAADPSDHRPHYLSGRILAQEGRYAEALTEFERSSRLYPSMEPPTERIGRSVLADKGIEEAVGFLRLARERRLCTYGCKGLLADLFRKQGDRRNAEAVYGEMTREAPEEPAAYVGLAAIANGASDYAKEAELLDRAVRARQFASLSDGQKADLHYRLAFARYNARAYPAAALAVDSALKISGDRAEWLVLAGWIAMKRERPDEAERFFSRAAARSPGLEAAEKGLRDARAAKVRLPVK